METQSNLFRLCVKHLKASMFQAILTRGLTMFSDINSEIQMQSILSTLSARSLTRLTNQVISTSLPFQIKR
jgi:hypothetical protein